MKYIAPLMLACALVTTTANAKPWNTVGKGEMHVLFWHAYDSALLAKEPVFDVKKPYALVNTYRMDFSKEDLIDRTFDEMKLHGTFTSQQQQAWRSQLSKLWPDVKENDRIRANIYPNKFVSFWVNGKKTGRISDATFAELFPAIWLGENTSEPALRKQLLGKN